jgi:hypothetical protein
VDTGGDPYSGPQDGLLTEQPAGQANEPKPGDYAYRDLSIQRQNRLNVAVTALVANLEHSAPAERIGRFITPDMILMFERELEQTEASADVTREPVEPGP